LAALALALAPAALAAEPAGAPAGAAPASPAPEKGAPAAPAPAKPSGTASQAPSAPVAPVARELAKALTPMAAWKGIMDGYASSLSGQISAALASTGKEPPANLETEIRKELDSAVRYEQAVDMQARALAGRFSADELRALESFYRTGPGKKLLEELPEIAQQVNDELRARLSSRVPQIVEKLAPSLAKGPEGEGAKATPKAQGRTPPADPGTPPRRPDQR
jgi:hypothetical protein